MKNTTVSPNRENIYLTEAYDVHDGSRFLGTVIWDGTSQWDVILRGSYLRTDRKFVARRAAIDYIEQVAAGA